MAVMEAHAARRFAEEWIDAWNRHDLDRVLSHYAEGVEFSSPLIADIAGVAGGVLIGKPALRAYWSKGLERIPDLCFELVDVLAGIDHIILYYRGHRGMVAESFVFGPDGRVVRAAACYS